MTCCLAALAKLTLSHLEVTLPVFLRPKPKISRVLLRREVTVDWSLGTGKPALCGHSPLTVLVYYINVETPVSDIG